jgi:alanine racemase
LTAPASLEDAGAVLDVSLSALKSNYRLLAEQAGSARCGASVKADAYGLGAAPVAKALAEEGCRDFFLAHSSEAKRLVGLVPDDARLFILNGLPKGIEGLAADCPQLVPVLNSVAQAEAWAVESQRQGRALPAALHVDTGMSRLGLSADEAMRLKLEGLWSRLDLQLVMSHLASAEDADAASNRRQLDAFIAIRAAFADVPASLANGSGIFLGSNYAFDLVRPGAALYGLNPQANTTNLMHQVVRLRAPVIQNRMVEAGTSVGYNGIFIAPRTIPAATVAIGYGDGWLRRAGGLGGFFEGVRLPIIGRISMDTTVLDCSALGGRLLQPGDHVELLCENQTPDQVAAASGTIGYEILTAIGSRVRRNYVA